MTTYKGHYRTERNGVRVGIEFTYNICPITNEFINEVETRVWEL